MLNIEQWQKNEILRKISTDISREKIKKYAKLWKEMIKYIKNPDNWWVGLAAPQVWYNKRLIVVSLLKNREDENYQTIMMINPEIIEHSDKKVLSEEWCLSIPEERGKVPRYNSIKIKYLDEKYKENIMILQWLKSNIVQHEIDHLDGILFTDRIDEIQASPTFSL